MLFAFLDESEALGTYELAGFQQPSPWISFPSFPSCVSGVYLSRTVGLYPLPQVEVWGTLERGAKLIITI